MPFPTSPVLENLFHRTAAVSLDILIIGGSIGGLSAAYNLKQAGHNVRVLERSDGELKDLEILGGMRVPPNMAKLLQYWGLGKQLAEKAVKCPRIDFLAGETGQHCSSIIYFPELMNELQADMYGMKYSDLYEMMRDLALRSGARIDYNCNVVDVNVDEASVLLEGGERIHADMVIGADGTTSLVRKVVAGEEAIEKGPYTTYSYIVPVKTMLEDPKLSSLVKDGTWTLWFGNKCCVLCYLVKSDEYVVHVIQPHDDAVPGWTHVVPLSKLNTSEFEDRVQRILALRPTAIETLHVIHSTIDGWFSKNGKVVLVGNCVHASCPSSTNGAALAVEDGAVLGSLFSRLRTRNQDEIVRLLGAYQEVRQERCQETIQADSELVAFSTLPPGPARDEREAGFRAARVQRSSDWENASEERLRNVFEEFRGAFAYEAYDAADDWWVDWGLMAQRATAVQTASRPSQEYKYYNSARSVNGMFSGKTQVVTTFNGL